MVGIGDDVLFTLGVLFFLVFFIDFVGGRGKTFPVHLEPVVLSSDIGLEGSKAGWLWVVIITVLWVGWVWRQWCCVCILVHRICCGGFSYVHRDKGWGFGLVCGGCTDVVVLSIVRPDAGLSGG